MADDRPVLTDVEQIAQLQRQIDDLRSTVLARASRMPTGTILGTLLATAPPDTLFLQGQTLTRAQYPVLWQWASDNALVGVAGLFGAGDNSTTFVLPDLRGRVLLGAGTLAVGAKVGADSLVLTSAQMPAHKHNITVANHANHSHTFNTNSAGTHGPHPGFQIPVGKATAPDDPTDIWAGPRSDTGSHSHGGATTSDSAGSHAWSEDLIGGTTPVDMRQASIAVNWLIWT